MPLDGPAGGEPACALHLVDDESGTLDERSSVVELVPTAPYRLDLTAWVLRRRDGNVVDRWEPEGQRYERVVVTDSGPLDVSVVQVGPPEEPVLRARLRGPGASLLRTRHQVGTTLARSLGMEADLTGFVELAGHDPRLGRLVERFRGVRPPRFHTWTEALTAAVSCQQLSLAVGITLLNRLAERYGERSPAGHVSFPTAEALAAASPDDLRAMGYSHRKAEVITELARHLADGELDLDPLGSADDHEVLAELCRLRGIGRWSAEYVMLRGMGRVHVFPGDDVGAQNKLRHLLGIEGPLDHATTRELLEQWHPFAGLIYFHLLLDGLADAGLVTPSG